MSSVQSFIEMHFSNNEFTLPLFEDNSYEFGILHVSTTEKILIKNKMAILFSIDGSASMSDLCQDNRSKMQYVKHTIKNILLLFSQITETDIYVAIDVFDDTIHPMFEYTKIDAQNVNDFINKIDNTAHPAGSTDIEQALIHAKTTMEEYKEKNPTHKMVHIQLTDGDITSGETNFEKLYQLLYPQCYNIFIGFGIDHDSELLQQLSKCENGEYYFVDKIEKSGMIYGEVVHGLLYPAIENGIIHMTNGQIYDWKNNLWSSELKLPTIPGNTDKVYQVRSKNLHAFVGELYGEVCSLNLNYENMDDSEYKIKTKIETVHVLPPLVELKTDQIVENDLTEYMYRQIVQELLFEVSEYNKFINGVQHVDITDIFKTPMRNRNRNMNDRQKDRELTMKRKLKHIFEMMKTYKETCDVNSEKVKFMKILMDDVYIAYKTIGTKYSQMYTTSRQRSQGRQQTYNVTNIHDIIGIHDTIMPRRSRQGQNSPLLSRTQTISRMFDDDDDESQFPDFPELMLPNLTLPVRLDPGLDQSIIYYNDDINDHELSENTDTTYANSDVLNLMREISENTNL